MTDHITRILLISTGAITSSILVCICIRAFRMYIMRIQEDKNLHNIRIGVKGLFNNKTHPENNDEEIKDEFKEIITNQQ